ncbi:hypothetical protein [Duganella sp. S19_KUP01_CR8]|uniref:hypothetical protein n=1 Tax=Duganella sp. S19_KUP01_CR8 TaxID=3025502 RepID=UPI002FCD93CC
MIDGISKLIPIRLSGNEAINSLFGYQLTAQRRLGWLVDWSIQAAVGCCGRSVRYTANATTNSQVPVIIVMKFTNFSNGQDNSMSKAKQRFLFKTEINSFHYLYQDAEYLLATARLSTVKGTFQETRVARSALLLYILSLEGLINRALDHFTPTPIHDFLIEREEKFNTADKWRLLALVAGTPLNDLDMGCYPWSHLSELIKIRNDYVHPKHNRMAYYEYVSATTFTHLDWKSIPAECGIKEKDLVYGQTKLPKDPYGFSLAHLENVKKIVDDTVAELDKVLAGKINKDDWIHSDQMKLFHPPGTTIDDIGR